ncbi:DegT/DnrJ/EryC1/StrS family aminotransferase [Nocardioides marmorisolisilvae]|uniref:DegT/DnrJ/EryC1/StrS family aminotransferase n=1 Tax=Nocardioides marmorisolisilvae TaxID=1542737 RepID=A0A3N0DU76_9ACTN|nr:DegT/DnrJ/EryC1/StrS family aminotransferase [Nocardioides marmorisolisilvae]RNL79071.1 DegT/DnrJ/EryC1/StrS family aminotransferase [Nocardioides marmorisolisilvae]
MTSAGENIPLTRPSTDAAELAAVAAVLESGWLAGQGPQGTLLEQEFAALTGRAHAVAVNNCTAGLHLAVEALGLEPGDEVLVADYSFPATAHAVLYVGGIPRFVDVRPDTGTIDASLIPDQITSRTRGIIGVDALGVPADWDQLEKLAAEHGLWLLEDAACSAGGVYQGRPCGSFGDVAVFSLHARKGITSGEGGVIVTDDADLAARMRSLSCFGMRSALSRQNAAVLEIPEFADLGYNYKLSDVLAGVARTQLGKLDGFLDERCRIAARYSELLGQIEGVTVPATLDDRQPTWQTYAVTLADGVDRNRTVVELRERGIGSNIGTYALHQQSVYEPSTSCPSSARLFARHLALPMYVGLREADQVRVASELTSVLAGLR